MGRLLFVVLGALTVGGCATESTPQGPPIELTRIHEVPGRTKAELCRHARDWAALTFRDSRAVVEVYDPEAGSMIGKGTFSIPVTTGIAPVSWTIRFTMVVDCKDARVRATYRDVSLADWGLAPADSERVKARTLSEQRLAELDASFGAALKKPSADW
jgi:hypothetical protein